MWLFFEGLDLARQLHILLFANLVELVFQHLLPREIQFEHRVAVDAVDQVGHDSGEDLPVEPHPLVTLDCYVADYVLEQLVELRDELRLELGVRQRLESVHVAFVQVGGEGQRVQRAGAELLFDAGLHRVEFGAVRLGVVRAPQDFLQLLLLVESAVRHGVFQQQLEVAQDDQQ